MTTPETATATEPLRLADAMGLLDPDRPGYETHRRTVQDEYLTSFWYAAGRVDEGGHIDVTTRTEAHFATLRAYAKAEYLTERRVDFGNLQGDWRTFLDTGRIT